MGGFRDQPGGLFRMDPSEGGKPFFENDADGLQPERFFLPCKVMIKGANATLVLYDDHRGTPATVWIPLSQTHAIHTNPDPAGGYTDTLIMTAWIAKKKGLL